MDVVYSVVAAVMFIAMLGMAMGCDKLGVRK